MPTPTPPSPPKIPTGQELFDTLMAHIEPELTTEGKKLAAEKYKNETEEQKAERMKRYELAFDRCNKAYTDYMATLDVQVERYRRDSFNFVEQQDKQEEANAIDTITAFIQGFAG